MFKGKRMKLKLSIIRIVVSFCFCASVSAQEAFSIPACGDTNPKKFVGERLRLTLSKDATLKKGWDIDYGYYYIGFGKKKERVWLSGIFGGMASSGEVSENWLKDSSEVTHRKWIFNNVKGTDSAGRLANGNYWRYIGTFGEAVEYYDVSKEAADYFDGILKDLCYEDLG